MGDWKRFLNELLIAEVEQKRQNPITVSLKLVCHLFLLLLLLTLLADITK